MQQGQTDVEMQLLDALHAIERRATIAHRDLATGAATTGASALAKIKTEAADARRHAVEVPRRPMTADEAAGAFRNAAVAAVAMGAAA